MRKPTYFVPYPECEIICLGLGRVIKTLECEHESSSSSDVTQTQAFECEAQAYSTENKLGLFCTTKDQVIDVELPGDGCPCLGGGRSSFHGKLAHHFFHELYSYTLEGSYNLTELPVHEILDTGLNIDTLPSLYCDNMFALNRRCNQSFVDNGNFVSFHLNNYEIKSVIRYKGRHLASNIWVLQASSHDWLIIALSSK